MAGYRTIAASSRATPKLPGLATTASALIVLCLLAGGSRGGEKGGGPTYTCGPGCIDFWFISTKCLPCGGNFVDQLDHIPIWHCEASGWVRYSRQQFVEATDSDVPICFYIHGLFSNDRMAMSQARDLFGKVSAGLPPFRGILWTWPSQFECGVSVRDQVNRANEGSQSQAFYMASIVDSLGPRVAVSLIGHSLGCRTIAATLHGIAARQIAGQPLPPPRFVAPRPIQATLIAPAIDPFALWPNREYGKALSQVDRMLITFNPEDRVLRGFERRFDRRALGLRGLPQPAAGNEDFQKVFQVNANPAIGKKHLPSAYFDSPIAANWLRGFITYLDEPEFPGGPL
jgi:hypothetical protein